MRGELSHELFMRLSAVLDKAMIEDLEILKGSDKEGDSLDDHFEGLYRCGLMDLNLSVTPLNRQAMEMGMQRGVELERRVKVRYKLNELGNLFIEHALEVDSDK